MPSTPADIEKNKIRGDLGITYDRDVIRLIDIFRELGLYVSSVVLTRYRGQHRGQGLPGPGWRVWASKVYHHYAIEGYPSNTCR